MVKRVAWIVGVLALLGGGYLTAAHFSGGALFSFGLPIGGDRALVRKLATSFWEDVRFKDFKQAASYHLAEVRDTVDIPFLLERLFLQKPELLDILGYEILDSELDSTGNRARVKTTLKVKDLVKEELRDQEVVLYFHRKSASEPWYMELESSLRKIEGEKDKIH